mmetsp:Transcript_52392/g.145158  ORF Transcript_52392/g.145158 Transcript_52392/m.145158 type:complete len:230 (-) Transcript_52392:42-731(-)
MRRLGLAEGRGQVRRRREHPHPRPRDLQGVLQAPRGHRQGVHRRRLVPHRGQLPTRRHGGGVAGDVRRRPRRGGGDGAAEDGPGLGAGAGAGLHLPHHGPHLRGHHQVRGLQDLRPGDRVRAAAARAHHGSGGHREARRDVGREGHRGVRAERQPDDRGAARLGQGAPRVLQGAPGVGGCLGAAPKPDGQAGKEKAARPLQELRAGVPFACVRFAVLRLGARLYSAMVR